jgi:hypothetical protein
MNKLFLTVLALLISFSAESAFALDANFATGIAKASLALGASDSVSVLVETIEPSSDFAYSKAYAWGGDETTPPKKIIKTITVLKNGQNLFIPLSAYADLGNPNKISLSKLPRGFRLTISGGDAAGSYDARLDFKKNEISRRRVASGEFPKEVWEETTFSFNHLNN